MKRFWTVEEDALFREHYPNSTMKQMMDLLGRSACSIYNHSEMLNVRKSKEYLASPAACRLRPDASPASIACRFQKGQVPVNKGVKGINYEGMKATQFAKGSRPPNYRPVGTIRDSRDGYYEIKMAEGMHQWRLLHRVIWERCNGTIPKDHIVSFVDRNPKNINIKNMALFTKVQNMQRNSLHSYPKEIATLIQLQGAINRQINKREKQNEQHRHA